MFISLSLSLFAVILTPYTITNVGASQCKASLKPVPINEEWLLDIGRKGGVVCMKGKMTQDQFTSAVASTSSPPGATGSKSICVSSKPEVGGKSMQDIQYECSYDNINEALCVSKGDITMKAAVPKYFTNVIIKSDNKTYAAIVSCVSGKTGMWSVLCSSDQPLSPDTQKAIRDAVGEKEGGGSSKDAIKLGKSYIKDGACQGGKAPGGLPDVGKMPEIPGGVPKIGLKKTK